MIKVLIVEDSIVTQEFLTHILSSDPEIQVIGTANNGEEAIEAVKRKRPNVITMDINMPKMNGFEATRRIMETVPTPIVIVSASWDVEEVATTFRAVEAGALTVVQKPVGIDYPDHKAMARELVQAVKLMSEVKVVRRWLRTSDSRERNLSRLSRMIIIPSSRFIIPPTYSIPGCIFSVGFISCSVPSIIPRTVSITNATTRFDVCTMMSWSLRLISRSGRRNRLRIFKTGIICPCTLTTPRIYSDVSGKGIISTTRTILSTVEG